MGMYLPLGEWGVSDTSHTEGEVVSLQLLDGKTETGLVVLQAELVAEGD